MRLPLQGRDATALSVLGIVCVSLILRGESCVTEDRSVAGVITVSMATPWHTQGFTDTSDSGTLADNADDIIDALSEVSTDEIRAALNAGHEVTVAGARGEVTASTGHDAERTTNVTVNGQTILDMKIPTNVAGTEVSASQNNPAAPKYLILGKDGVDELATALTSFLNLYLDGDENGARAVLAGVSWAANWTSNPAPTQQDPDDFHWQAELVVNIPVLFEVTTPNF